MDSFFQSKRVDVFLVLVCFFVAIASKAEAEKRILVLGDSLTAGYGIAQENAYPALVEKTLKSKGHKVKVVNAGSSGSTSASGPSRLKWHLKAKPDLLVLALGSNDGLRGVDLKSTKENLEKTIKLAQENKIRTVLVGMKLPMNYEDKYRKQFEELFQELVKEYKLGYIPFLLRGVGGKPKLNLPDGIHPNEKGHKIIAETVAKALEEYL